MDEFAEQIMDKLKDEAVKAGMDVIDEGVDLLKKHMTGDASDAEIMAWLRRTQGGA